MRRHFPHAWVEGYDHLIPAMTNHSGDRHVLAAAVEAQAEIVVTYNLRDFEPESLSPYNIKAMGPSSFLRILYERNPKAVLRTLHEQAESIRESTGFVLDRLEVNVPAFIASLRTQL